MAEALSSDYEEMELSKAVKLISENAKDVFVDKEKIKQQAQEVMKFINNDNFEQFYRYNSKFIRPEAFPRDVDDEIIANWLFVLNTLNFSLWYPKGTKQWTVNGKAGYRGLCNAMKRAIDYETPLWDPKWYARMREGEFEYTFRGDDIEICLPLIDKRVEILHKVGKVLLNTYKGSFLNCIKSCDYDADRLIKLLYDEFESYRDEVIYNEKKVCFLTKATVLVSDLWMYFKARPKFKLDTKKFISSAIFIDYRIPQLLLQDNILRYSDALVKRLENSDEPLEYGGREEIEIRGCSLFAIQEICKEMQKIKSRYADEKPILKTKAFNIPVVVNNFFFAILFVANSESSYKQYPLHYIKTVHY